ncbi:MAG: hypothetical protein V3V62_07480 [bacterium]
MNSGRVSCEEFRGSVEALAAGALEKGESDRLLAHKDACDACRFEFEGAERLVVSLASLPSFSPRPHVVENLERVIEAERDRSAHPSLLTALRKSPIRRHGAALALGIAAALFSALAFGKVAASEANLGRTLLVGALFWAWGYTRLFDLTFGGMVDLRAREGHGLMRAAERVSVPALLALALGTGGLLWFSSYGGFGLLPAQGGGGVPVSAQFSVPYSGWFFLGAGISGASLLGGVLLGRPMGRGRPLINGALVGCIFMVMIIPAFAIVCVPFTLGLFLTLAAGLALGSLSGGILGFWTLRRMRAFR